jgi:Phytanoyl-CoA dioxygenase (PhyH)
MGRSALIAHAPLLPFWLRGALPGTALAAIGDIADSVGRPGGRIDWTHPLNATVLQPVTDLVSKHALPGARLVRVVWFTKNSSANWGVPWHQDRIIAVAHRHDVADFGNWTQKAGIWHCEPPLATLNDMRFVRLHLDDCDAKNGAMEIALGSEARGIVPESEASNVAATFPTELCAARRGDLHVLPMLVLHRSKPSSSTMPRRALRLDYAFRKLPPPLAWLTA